MVRAAPPFRLRRCTARVRAGAVAIFAWYLLVASNGAALLLQAWCDDDVAGEAVGAVVPVARAAPGCGMANCGCSSGAVARPCACCDGGGAARSRPCSELTCNCRPPHGAAILPAIDPSVLPASAWLLPARVAAPRMTMTQRLRPKPSARAPEKVPI